MSVCTRWCGSVPLLLAGAVVAGVGAAQQPVQKAPTADDWAGIAKYPDFTGVWELVFGGPPGAPPQRPSLTPEYAARKKARDASAPEDSQSANCLPPGMPGIMGQPYPMEFLLTPGQVTIVIEA